MDFRIGVRHGENQRVRRHLLDHVLGHAITGRQAKKMSAPSISLCHVLSASLACVAGFEFVMPPDGPRNEALLSHMKTLSRFKPGLTMRSRRTYSEPASRSESLPFFAGSLSQEITAPSIPQPCRADRRKLGCYPLTQLFSARNTGGFDVLEHDATESRFQGRMMFTSFSGSVSSISNRVSMFENFFINTALPSMTGSSECADGPSQHRCEH